MKLWDLEKNEFDNVSKLLNIGKGSIVQIAGSGGKTTLTHLIAGENPDLKCAIITTTKRLAPEKGYILNEGETIDLSNETSNVIEAGIVAENGKIGWVGDDNYKIIKDWADLVIIEADGSKGKPIKACNPGEPVFVEDATHTIVVTGMSALTCEMKEVCHRFELVELIYNHYKSVTPNEIGYLIRKYYATRFKNLNPVIIFNQCDDEDTLDKALSIVKANKFNGYAAKFL